jgi:hypothetical protein
VYLASGTGLRIWESLCNGFSDVTETHCEGGSRCMNKEDHYVVSTPVLSAALLASLFHVMTKVGSLIN